MKKIFLAVVLAAMCGSAASAQEKGVTAGMWYQQSVLPLNGHKEMTESNFHVSVGYAFNKLLFVRTNAEIMSGFFDVSPVKTFEKTATLGLTVGINAVNTPNFGILEAALTGGSTIAKTNWNFASYDMALRWYPVSTKQLKYGMGMGARYFQSYDSNHGDYCTFYVSIGFRLN